MSLGLLPQAAIFALGVLMGSPTAQSQVDSSKLAQLSEFMQQLAGDVDVSSDGDGVIDLEKGAVSWSGNVRIKVAADEIFSDEAQFDSETQNLTVSGNVSIYRGGMLYRGQSASYNIETSRLDTRDLKTSVEPLLIEAGSLPQGWRDGWTPIRQKSKSDCYYSNSQTTMVWVLCTP